MKKIHIILLAGLMLVSCNDWLNVQPSTEIEKDKAVETEQGFRDILIGSYIRMKSTALYGRELTWGSVEYLAQHWEYTPQSAEQRLSEYSYYSADVQNITGNIYLNLYKTIADVNGILDVIDSKKAVFSDGGYELVKGEALAIRAFCHFDLLRLFGPIPSKEIPGGTVLPYVKTVSRNPNPHLTYAEFTKKLLDDLDKAEEYLLKIDPITKYSIALLNSPSKGAFRPSDTFWAYRQKRMNYYGAQALKARVYLWLNDKTNALKYANVVINAKDETGAPMYKLGTKANMEASDYTLSPEHIVTLAVHELGEQPRQDALKSVFTVKAKIERFYTPTDTRFTTLWVEELDQNVKKHRIKKYQSQESIIVEWQRNTMSLIRLYEMYLIAMECSPETEAVRIWNQILSPARDVEPVTDFATTEKLNDLLAKEYNREFYAEGQAFFAYKRLARETILNASKPGNQDTYVIPMPKQEFTGFGAE